MVTDYFVMEITMSDNPASVPEGRRATEYLANERTFLAWVRTSIALIGIGAVLAKLNPILHATVENGRLSRLPMHIGSSVPAGIAFMVFGAVIAGLAAWRYHVVNLAIERGQVKADRGLILLVTILVVALAVAMSLYLLVTSDQP
jgi:inner membrane protein YidH